MLPTNTTAGQHISPAVTVEILDQSGHVFSTDNSDQVTVAVAAGPGTRRVRGTTTDGQQRRGHVQQLASEHGGDLQPERNGQRQPGQARFRGFTVTPAAVNQLVFGVQPTNTTAGVAIAPAVIVKIEDQFGNVVTTDNTDTVTVNVASGPGTFTATSTVTMVSNTGVATFSNLRLNTAGSYTLSRNGQRQHSPAPIPTASRSRPRRSTR